MRSEDGKNKIYMFYYIGDETEDSFLYAYTDDKNLAKLFEDFRDKKIFKKVKVYLDYRQLNDLYKLYPEEELQLFYTFTRDSKNTEDCTSVQIALTKSEQLSVETEYDSLFYYKLQTLVNSFNPYIFKNSLRKALDILDYTYNYQFFNEPESLPYDVQYSYNMDGFQLFYDLFKKYIRKCD